VRGGSGDSPCAPARGEEVPHEGRERARRGRDWWPAASAVGARMRAPRAHARSRTRPPESDTCVRHTGGRRNPVVPVPSPAFAAQRRPGSARRASAPPNPRMTPVPIAPHWPQFSSSPQPSSPPQSAGDSGPDCATLAAISEQPATVIPSLRGISVSKPGPLTPRSSLARGPLWTTVVRPYDGGGPPDGEGTNDGEEASVHHEISGCVAAAARRLCQMRARRASFGGVYFPPAAGTRTCTSTGRVVGSAGTVTAAATGTASATGDEAHGDPSWRGNRRKLPRPASGEILARPGGRNQGTGRRPDDGTRIWGA